jgi:hypothetical protein
LDVYYRLCIAWIMHRQLWGYRVEEKLLVGGTRTRTSNTAVLKGKLIQREWEYLGYVATVLRHRQQWNVPYVHKIEVEFRIWNSFICLLEQCRSPSSVLSSEASARRSDLSPFPFLSYSTQEVRPHFAGTNNESPIYVTTSILSRSALGCWISTPNNPRLIPISFFFLRHLGDVLSHLVKALVCKSEGRWCDYWFCFSIYRILAASLWPRSWLSP